MSENLVKGVGTFKVNGTMQPCCMDPRNRTKERNHSISGHITVQLCQKCGRKHYTMHAEPGVYKGLIK